MPIFAALIISCGLRLNGTKGPKTSCLRSTRNSAAAFFCASVSLSAAIGGNGGGGGDAKDVTVTNSALIRTSGDDSSAILAQSIGKGGGNGGFSFAGSMAGKSGKSASLTIGGFFYETAQGRTMLPASLTANGRPLSARWTAQANAGGRTVRLSVSPQDANFDFAVENVVDGACYNAGQSCCAVERAYVHAKLHDAFVEKAADGYNILPAYFPGAFNDFIDLVVPELQRRGLFRKEYAGRSLREHFDLPPVPVPGAQRQALAGE